MDKVLEDNIEEFRVSLEYEMIGCAEHLIKSPSYQGELDTLQRLMDRFEKLFGPEKESELESQNKALRELVGDLNKVITRARQLTHNQIVTLPIKYQSMSLGGVAQDLGYWEETAKEKLREIGGE